MVDASLDGTLAVAKDVVAALERHNARALVVGAMALAVHRYPRDTVDFDLATAIDPRELEAVGNTLQTSGYEVELHKPDPDDPLGGVLDVRAVGAELVQIVNFSNPPSGGFPRLVVDALETAIVLVPGEPLLVAALPALIAFKLYAGGRKSQLDILELLDRNPEVDLEALRGLCREYRLDQELERVLGMRG